MSKNKMLNTRSSSCSSRSSGDEARLSVGRKVNLPENILTSGIDESDVSHKRIINHLTSDVEEERDEVHITFIDT